MAYPGGTIVNPSIPYSAPIPGGLSNGKMITVQGKVHHHQQGFSINLCLGPNPDPLPDTALHFNVRFNEGCIVRNHQQYGSWGTEERGGGLPLQKGVPFEIIIMVQQNCYKVSVNGRHFTDFRHRLPKESAQYLVVAGGVEVSFIKFEGGAQPPGYNVPRPGLPTLHFPPYVPPPAYNYPQPGYPSPPYHPSYPMGAAPPPSGQPVYNPPVPYTANIPGGLYPGRMIFISGIPYPNPTRFTVNLQCGPFEASDVAMTFDARFNFGGCYNETVRNHKTGSSWGTEEKHQNYFPFMPNASFDMIILVEPASIKVAVNNQHYAEFHHRIQPLSRADYLTITGDVRLTSVRIQ